MSGERLIPEDAGSVTGVLLLQLRGVLRWSGVLAEPAFWSTGFGFALAVKLALVVLMLALGAVHDFALGPAAARLDAGSPRARSLRRRASWLARVNAAAGVVLLLAAASLARS